VGNACGTVGMLHAIANANDDITLDGERFKQVISFSTALIISHDDSDA